MKTALAPDTLAAPLESIRETLAALGPSAAVFAAVVAAIVIASAAARNL